MLPCKVEPRPLLGWGPLVPDAVGFGLRKSYSLEVARLTRPRAGEVMYSEGIEA